jgi:hypothetical protein
MYEEMLQLVKDGLDTPSKEMIENPNKIQEEEKKGSNDSGNIYNIFNISYR